MRRWLFRLLVLYFGALALVWMFRIQLIYPFDPTRITPNDPRISEVIFETPDGTELITWQAKPRGAHPTILYLHGNAGGLNMRAQRFDRLLRQGYGVIAPAYRGSSGSQGTPDQNVIIEDLIAFVDQLPNPPQIYHGESLGTGVAMQLTLERPPQGLVLEAPYRSVVELAAKSFPIFPVRTMLDQRWDSLAIAGQIDVPTLVLHGEADLVIPVDHGKSIFAALGTNNKQLKILKDRGHSGLWTAEGQTAIYRFIDGL